MLGNFVAVAGLSLIVNPCVVYTVCGDMIPRRQSKQMFFVASYYVILDIGKCKRLGRAGAVANI